MNQKELKALLDVVGKQLAAKVEQVQSDLDRAEEIATKLDGYLSRSEGLLKRVEDPTIGAEAKLEGVEQEIAQIRAQSSQATAALTEIQTTLSQVQTHAGTMASAFAAFQQLQMQIDEPGAGLQAVLNKAAELIRQITGEASRSTTLVEQIETDLSGVKANLGEMRAGYQAFIELKAQIDEPSTGFQAAIDQVTALRAESKSLTDDIRALQGQSQGDVVAIKKLLDQAQTDSEAINNTKSESENLREQIEKVLKLATDTGLANAFDERRKAVERQSGSWLNGVVGIAILIVGIAVILAFTHRTQTLQQIALTRLVYLTPLLVLFGLAWSQYLKERNLSERYAFKAAMALSLETYTDLLARRFPSPDAQEQILDFVLDAMRSIYKEPHQDKSRTSFRLDAGNNALWVKYSAEEFAEISNRPKGRKKTKKAAPTGQSPKPE